MTSDLLVTSASPHDRNSTNTYLYNSSLCTVHKDIKRKEEKKETKGERRGSYSHLEDTKCTLKNHSLKKFRFQLKILCYNNLYLLFC